MKIGDKVVCVNDSPCRCGCGEPCEVKKDAVYVISGFTIGSNGDLGLNLVGVVPFAFSMHINFGWSSSRFRLLDELKEQNATKQRQAQVA